MWLGVHTEDFVTWKSTRGIILEPDLLLWEPDLPNNYDGKQYFVAIKEEKLFDRDINSRHRSICDEEVISQTSFFFGNKDRYKNNNNKKQNSITFPKHLKFSWKSHYHPCKLVWCLGWLKNRFLIFPLSFFTNAIFRFQCLRGSYFQPVFSRRKRA